jgi:hypothetical protein
VGARGGAGGVGARGLRSSGDWQGMILFAYPVLPVRRWLQPNGHLDSDARAEMLLDEAIDRPVEGGGSVGPRWQRDWVVRVSCRRVAPLGPTCRRRGAGATRDDDEFPVGGKKKRLPTVLVWAQEFSPTSLMLLIC